jgi:dihydrofolate reductase
VRRIEGYVIVSADGMIADGNGEMPPSIRNDADQRFFQDALDHAAVVVHGRHSHEGGPRAARRKRLILTRRIAALAPDAAHPNSLLWNPAGASLDAALDRHGIGDGTVAIIGGTEAFSLFLPQYTAFHLSRAANARIPGGLPVFSEVGPNVTPEDVLARYGLKPGPRHELDTAAAISVATWQR